MHKLSSACAVVVLVPLSVFVACTSPESTMEGDEASVESTGPTTGDSEPTVLYNACARDARVGGFEATVLSDYSGVQGAVANGIVPASVTTSELEEGRCILWKRHNLFCDPPCAADETCDFDGTCIASPVNQNLGTVTVQGLHKDIVMEPREPGNNYFDADLPHPIFDLSNQVVELTSTAGYLRGVTLDGEGSDAIAPQAEEWIVTPGEDLTLDWDAPPAGARTAVVLTLSVDQHGSTPSSLECVFDDTGQGVVPAGAIDGLVNAGVTGFPSGRLTRATVDSVLVDVGCIDFAVKSYKPVDVSVSGFIPCTGPGTCPGDLVCNLVTFLCE